MKNIPLLLGTIVGTFAAIFLIAVLFSRSAAPEVVDAQVVKEGARHVFTTQSENASASASAQVADASEEAVIDLEQKMVQIVEFSDFQCPACRAALPIKDALMEQYPNQVEFVYRHYPLLQIHPNAMISAQAAELAGEYGKFWPMHDLLFENQEVWSDQSMDEAKQTFRQYAEQLGIPGEEFTTKLDDARLKESIQQDISVGDTVRVSGTPTFFVNGQKVSAPEVIPTVSELLQ